MDESVSAATGTSPVDPEQRHEADVGITSPTHQSSTDLIVYSPPMRISKRTRPPSPSTSDDEFLQNTKYSKSDPSPFSIDYSPIEVVDSLTDLITAAAAQSKAKATEVAMPPLLLDAAKELTPDADAIESKPKRQLSLAAFYPPQSLADAQAQLEQESAVRKSKPIAHWSANFPSPELDALLDDLRSPRAIAAWLLALHARVISVPGNGGCLYYSLHGCRTRWKLPGKSISARTTATKFSKHTVEANHYKKGMCERFIEYLEQMISDGTLTIAGLNRRFFGTGQTSLRKAERQAAIGAILVFIDGVAKANVGKGLSRAQWGADAEVFAMVWFIREPIFILTEAADETTSVRLIWLDRPHSDGPERIMELLPDAGEAFEMLRSFLRHRVLPTVLIHTSTAGDGHYNSLRFEESFHAD